MKTIRLVKVLLLAFVLAAFAASLVQGKPADSKKEKTGCVTCHVKAGSKDLNDTGKCYSKNGSLKDCKTDEKGAAKK